LLDRPISNGRLVVSSPVTLSSGVARPPTSRLRPRSPSHRREIGGKWVQLCAGTGWARGPNPRHCGGLSVETAD
jgi:hypothetical protein